jgi:hypothetical protein
VAYIRSDSEWGYWALELKKIPVEGNMENVVYSAWDSEVESFYDRVQSAELRFVTMVGMAAFPIRNMPKSRSLETLAIVIE